MSSSEALYPRDDIMLVNSSVLTMPAPADMQFIQDQRGRSC